MIILLFILSNIKRHIAPYSDHYKIKNRVKHGDSYGL